MDYDSPEWKEGQRRLAEMASENARLRADLDALRQQEPVGWCFENDEQYGIALEPDRDPNKLWLPLYLAPGAQPAVNEGARLVSYAMDGATCTLNIGGVEMYYDRMDRDAQPAVSAPECDPTQDDIETERERLRDKLSQAVDREGRLRAALRAAVIFVDHGSFPIGWSRDRLYEAWVTENPPADTHAPAAAGPAAP